MGSVLETMLRKVARLNKKYVHLCKVQKQAKVIHGDTLKTVVTLAGFGINWEMAWGSLGRFWKCFNLNGQSVSSVAQSCSTLCDPMNCSTPGLPVHHQLPQFTQTHVHWVDDAIPAISSSVVPFSSRLQSFPASRSFPMSQFFASGGQSIRASASASVLPMNVQGW